MDKIRVAGGRPLKGEIEIAGAKNACLALMPAALLTDQPLTLTNAPRLEDIRTMTTLLASLGAEVASLQDGNVLALSAKSVGHHTAPYDLVRKMRASILVLGPLLARVGQRTVSLPGGCAIGARPVDLHLKALEALGAEIELARAMSMRARAEGGLTGADDQLSRSSPSARPRTLLMAAVLARGETVLENAAREPEIADLAECLIAMGAKIEGARHRHSDASHGVDELHGATHAVMPDRIETGTYAWPPRSPAARSSCGGTRELIGGAGRRCSRPADAGDRRGRHGRRQGDARATARLSRRRCRDRAVSRLSRPTCRRSSWR